MLRNYLEKLWDGVKLAVTRVEPQEPTRNPGYTENPLIPLLHSIVDFELYDDF